MPRSRFLCSRRFFSKTPQTRLPRLREVFFDEPRVKYLIPDRDSKFNGIIECLKSAGAKSVRTAYRAPWQNGICERFCLTLRCDLLDHVVVLNEAHARRSVPTLY